MVAGSAPIGAYVLGGLQRVFHIGDPIPEELQVLQGTKFQTMVWNMIQQKGHVCEYRPYNSDAFQIPGFFKRPGSTAPGREGFGATRYTMARVSIAGLAWDAIELGRDPRMGDRIVCADGVFEITDTPWADRDGGLVARWMLPVEGVS